jgi:hypothetical protein
MNWNICEILNKSQVAYIIAKPSWGDQIWFKVKFGNLSTSDACKNYQIWEWKYDMKEQWNWFIIFCFTSRSRIFHSHGDVTTAGEGLQTLSLCSVLRAFLKTIFYSYSKWIGSGRRLNLFQPSPYIKGQVWKQFFFYKYISTNINTNE